jgi:hypothetical protein
LPLLKYKWDTPSMTIAFSFTISASDLYLTKDNCSLWEKPKISDEGYTPYLWKKVHD